jgi:hypothetical protein
MTDTGNVADIPLGMHPPKKGEQIGPGVTAEEDENMEETLKEVINDLTKLEEAHTAKSFISDLDEAIFKRVSGYIKDTIEKAKTGRNHRDAHGDPRTVGGWGVSVGRNDGPRHPSMARKKDSEEPIEDSASPELPSPPVVENTRVNGFRGIFKEGMQVSGDHRNRARRKLASWMGV